MEYLMEIVYQNVQQLNVVTTNKYTRVREIGTEVGFNL